MLVLASALIVLTIAALYLLSLGALALTRPKKLTVFLSGFARSPQAHYAELLLRSLAGVSFLAVAPYGPFPHTFTIVGWVLLGTSAALLLVPWYQHRRFAQRMSPLVTALAPMIGVTSLAAGIALSTAIVLTARTERPLPGTILEWL